MKVNGGFKKGILLLFLYMPGSENSTVAWQQIIIKSNFYYLV